MNNLANIDLKRTDRNWYTARGEPSIVELPTLPHLMIDGTGDPNTAKGYGEAVAALYPIAYAVRKAVIAACGERYTVMPLEGLWWTPDMADFTTADKNAWHWTLLIRQPPAATSDLVTEAIASTTATKRLAAGDLVRFETLTEGSAAQVMHRGPYAEEAPTIARLHDFIHDGGYALTGSHHEIYLSDPRRVAAEKMRTILRQPISLA